MERPDLKSTKKEVKAYIEYLEEKTKTPYFQSFLSLKKIVDGANEQIGETKIDLFSEEGERKFKLISKFATDIDKLYDKMEYLKQKMSPDEYAEANKLSMKPEGVESFLKERGEL